MYCNVKPHYGHEPILSTQSRGGEGGRGRNEAQQARAKRLKHFQTRKPFWDARLKLVKIKIVAKWKNNGAIKKLKYISFHKQNLSSYSLSKKLITLIIKDTLAYRSITGVLQEF